MDGNSQRIVCWWILVCCSPAALSGVQLPHGGGPGATDPRAFVWPYGALSSLPLALESQQSAELSGFSRPRAVEVRCHPDLMEVVVQADLFDTGLRVDGGHLRLGPGGTECGAFPSGEAEFTLLTGLTACGTELSSTEEDIVYSNVLIYSPQPSSAGLLRLDGAAVPVECRYEKRYSVDGIALHPTWVPFVFMSSTDERLYFNLRLMTDDWQSERGSFTYFVGDPMHFEISVVTGRHVPLRVYVDHCVATATPDAEATLGYDFIEHHGCLADAYLTNSKSRFLPRVEEHKLRFQIEAFRFYQEASNRIYITCYVKAVPVMLADSKNRACSFISNRWESVDGRDHVCRSCDVSQRDFEPQTIEPPRTITSTTAWDPLTKTPPENVIQSPAEHYPATYVRFRPGTHTIKVIKPQPSSALMKRDADYKLQSTVHLGPIVVQSRKDGPKRTDSRTVRSYRNKIL